MQQDAQRGSQKLWYHVPWCSTSHCTVVLVRPSPALHSAFRRRSHMGRSSALPHANPALYFKLPRRYSFTSLVPFFALQRRYCSRCTGAIFLAAPALFFMLRQRSPSCSASGLFHASSSLFLTLCGCPLSHCTGSILCTSLAHSLALRRQA